MKVSNAVLLVLGILFACLSSANAGVRRGDGAVTSVLADEDQVEAYEEEDEEGDMERLLTKTRLKKRCPFPGEVDDVDHFCDYDDTPLYKPDKWCKKYCYVCPCWDLETYFDWKGNFIEDVCSEDFCGKKDHENPCMKNEKSNECCECTKCKQLEILPADHFLCEPKIPPTCEETLPDGQDICRATCPDGEGECVSINGKRCACRNPCESLKPNKKGRCPGFCPLTGDICAPDGDGGCTCGPECEDAKPHGKNNKCFGFCPGGESPDACVFDGKDGCTCDPVCEDFEPDDDGKCPDICPGNGECAPDGKGGCTCDPVCEDFEPDEMVNALTSALEMAYVPLTAKEAVLVTCRLQFVRTYFPTLMESALTYVLRKTAFVPLTAKEAVPARKDAKPRILMTTVNVPVNVHLPIRNASTREEAALV